MSGVEIFAGAVLEATAPAVYEALVGIAGAALAVGEVAHEARKNYNIARSRYDLFREEVSHQHENYKWAKGLLSSGPSRAYPTPNKNNPSGEPMPSRNGHSRRSSRSRSSSRRTRSPRGRSRSSSRSSGLTPLTPNRPRGRSLTRRSSSSRSRSVVRPGNAFQRGGSSNDPIPGMMGATSISVNKPVKHKRVGGSWLYQSNNAGFLINNTGTQNAIDMVTVMSAPQVVTASGNGFTFYQGYKDLMGLNPYQFPTGSTLWGTAGLQVQPKADCCYLDYVTLEIDLTNLQNAPADVTLYVSKCKQSTPYGPSAWWVDGLTKLGVGTAISNMVNPTTAGLATAGVPIYSIPGTELSDGKSGKAFWKVAAKQNFMMATGACHKISLKINVNKVLRKEYFDQQVVAGQIYVPGTIHLWAICKGILCDDTFDNTPEYGSTRVCWASIVRYHMHAVAGNANRLNTQYTVDTMITGTANANLHFMSPGGTNVGISQA